MTIYVLKRLVQALVTLLVISFLAFILTRLIPGDPAQALLGPVHATPANLARVRHKLGIDRPLVDQYVSYIGGIIHLDFGESIQYHEPVGDLILPRLWPSLWLVLYAYVLALLVVAPLGVLAAVRRNRPTDHAIRFVSTVGYATPAFLVGLVLITVFSLDLGLFPIEGYGSTPAEHLSSLTLPAVTVAIFVVPLLLRTLRSEMIGTLRQDYIEAAHARGLSGRRVLFKHAMRNSVLPTLTVLGVAVGTLLSADVLVEKVFSIPGLGSLLIESVNSRDYPVIQALFILFSGAVVIASLITDLLYLVVDPRLRA